MSASACVIATETSSAQGFVIRRSAAHIRFTGGGRDGNGGIVDRDGDGDANGVTHGDGDTTMQMGTDTVAETIRTEMGRYGDEAEIPEGWLEIDKHYSLELCFSIEKQPE